eukprot:10832604-Ditylum_brightwellii.AAC.1
MVGMGGVTLGGRDVGVNGVGFAEGLGVGKICQHISIGPNSSGHMMVDLSFPCVQPLHNPMYVATYIQK